MLLTGKFYGFWKYNWQIYLPGVDDTRAKVFYIEGQKALLIDVHV